LKKEIAVDRVTAFGSENILVGQIKGVPALLVKTGVGKEAAAEAARHIAETYSPQFMLSIGLAGGTAEELRGGDLIICPRVYQFSGQIPRKKGLRLPGGLSSNKDLVTIATEVLRQRCLRFHHGDSLTVPVAVRNPIVKRWLGLWLPVKIVEMESYWIAQEARQKRIPFLEVRAVSDGWYASLPELKRILGPTGRLAPAKAVPHFLKKPTQFLPFLQFTIDSRKASANLTDFAVSFVSRFALG